MRTVWLRRKARTLPTFTPGKLYLGICMGDYLLVTDDTGKEKTYMLSLVFHLFDEVGNDEVGDDEVA